MQASKLADRVRGVLNASGTPRSEPLVAPEHCAGHLEAALGGEWRECGGGMCFVVERRFDGDAVLGATSVGDLAARLGAAAGEAPVVAGASAARPPFVFFDLETTGLSGGAGTYAFLVGCGWVDGRAFVTRQYLLTRFDDEATLLGEVSRELDRAGALVSFNGKSFDAPLLETRYLYHRLPWPGARLPHVDVLHAARRMWGGDERGGASPECRKSCSLVSLEQQILGARRVGDVPGFEIPARYFQFVRSRDPQPLGAVLEHNRRDVLSLAGLTSRLLDLVRRGPDAARDAREALALGRLYERARVDERARSAYARAAGADGHPLPGRSVFVRVEALRALALLSRRARRHDEAAAWWRCLLDTAACPRHVAREATEALAIHHEHRVRDLETARAFALRSLEPAAHAAWNEGVRHRLARIERKMSAAAPESSLRLD